MNIIKALAVSDYQCEERTAEITWLAQQASSRKLIAEIGSWKGCTTRALADNTDGLVYAIDTWEGSVGEEINQKLSEKPEEWLYNEFKRNTADLWNLRIIKSTSVKAAEMFSHTKLRFDMIFIDASHDYESVKADILAWRPLLDDGGLLCGHDRQWDGVAEAIKELIPKPEVGVGAIWYSA